MSYRHAPPMQFAHVNVRIWMAVIASTVAVVCASCQPVEQGYWTKQDMSQALTNKQYPNDSGHCDAMAANDGSGGSDQYKATLYTKCMQAQGYQWVIERSPSLSLKADANASAPIPLCPTGRLIVDSFGYHKCVPAGAKDRGMLIEVVPHGPSEGASTPPRDSQPPLPIAPTNERWSKDHGVCRQYAKDSLSSPYGVYTQCMKDKGWSSGS